MVEVSPTTQFIFEPDMKFFITGTRRGLGKALQDRFGNCDSIDECDIFINCKDEDQVERLHYAAERGKRIINIGSHASDFSFKFPYGLRKKYLRDASNMHYFNGVHSTVINFGYIDTESQEGKNVKKMSVDYAVSVVEWVLNQPHPVKEITICA